MSPEELEARRAAANPKHEGDPELLQDGQEEVFSRAEVERGAIEHSAEAGKHSGPSLTRRDEDQTRRQAPESANPGEPASR